MASAARQGYEQQHSSSLPEPHMLRAREWLGRSPSRPMHPGWLRCSSVTYQQYAPSSRLAIRAPRPRSSTDLAIPGPLALGFQGFSDVAQVFGGGELVVEGAEDATVGVDDVGDAQGAVEDGHRRAVGFDQAALGVDEQRKGHAVLVTEALVRVGAVAADADDGRAELR